MESLKEAFYFAIIKGDISQVESLLQNGIDPNIRDEYGDTPLHVASRWGHVEIVKLLLNYGADPYSENVYGNTPLHIAAFEGKAKVIEEFLIRGIDPDIRNNNGNTPLHEASCRGNIEAIKVLLDYGANPNVKNNLGFTPLHEASLNGDAEVVEILLRYGADPSVKNYQGLTPVELTKNHEIRLVFEKWSSFPLIGSEIHGYKIISFDYEGENSYIYKAKKGSDFYAIKIYKKVVQRKKEIKGDLTEELIYPSFNSPYFIRVFEVLKDCYGFETCEVMEFAWGGNLKDLLIKRKDLLKHEKWEKAVAFLIKIIALGLKDLHNFGYVHLEIKPENIYIMNKIPIGNNYELIMFILSSAKIKIGKTTSATKIGELVTMSSPNSVEQLEFTANPKMDVYSLGETAYFLMKRRDYYDRGGLCKYLLDCKEIHDKWNTLPDKGIWGIIKEMLNPNQDERITLDDVILKVSDFIQ